MSAKDPASTASLRRALDPSLPVLEEDDPDRCIVFLTLAEFQDGERRELPDVKSLRFIASGYNVHFKTFQTYGPEESEIRAVETLDRAISRLVAAGWRLLCSPKTVEDDHHDWRRICRVASPDGRRFSLIAWAQPMPLLGDWWMC